MSAASFTLARRMTEKVEPDMLRKCLCAELMLFCFLLRTTFSLAFSRGIFFCTEENFVQGELPPW